jgi:casein kinase 1
VLIDFGMARMFINPTNQDHIPNKMSNTFFGTPKYVSFHLHLGNRPSRRDDLISVGYVAMWCFGVEMEWSNLCVPNSDLPLYHIRHPGNVMRARCKKPENILAKISNQYLKSYFECVYSLEHDEDPNYNEYLRIFSTLY